jgi:hypothetical protein
MKTERNLLNENKLLRPNDISIVENLDTDFDFNSLKEYHQHVLDTKAQVIAEYTKFQEIILSKLNSEQSAKELDDIVCNRKGTTKPSDIQSLEMRAVAIVSIMTNRISWNLYEQNPNDMKIEMFSGIYIHANIIITENASPVDRQTYYLLKS